MTEPSTPLRRELHALPDIPLPDALWQRVEAGRQQKMRRRKLGAGIVSLALVTAMATPLIVPLLTGADTRRDEPVVAYQPANGQRDIQADLHVLDQALQAAYDRGASDAEVAPMWVARKALLAGIESASAASRRDRI
ncbi:MAG: hypothetical protein ABI538_04885 [Pseudoxanthomonas sp.]